MQDAACHDAIANASLHYLLQFQQPLSQEVLDESALARYSAMFWHDHLRKSGDGGDDTVRLAVNLLSTDNPAFTNWVRLCIPDETRLRSELSSARGRIAPPLYYAAKLGLTTTTKLLLDRGVDVNAKGGNYDNALCAAAFGGHLSIVERLLDSGADVDARSEDGGNAVYQAILGIDSSVNSFARHMETVVLLLDRGSVVTLGGNWGNALQAASHKGHDEIVKLLLDRGAQVNAHGGYYGYALQAAAFSGTAKTVTLLLDRGARINEEGGSYGTALHAAASRGRKDITELLLDRGANISMQCGRYGNALQAAVHWGYKDVYKLLISRLGITLPVQDPYGRSLLWWAAAGGQVDTVETLIREYNFDPGAPDKFGRTPFWIAVKNGHDAVVKLLWEECGETSIERPVLVKTKLDQAIMVCDVCTSLLIAANMHYHCYICDDGDWDMCEDCKASGASCTNPKHTLVKRAFRNGRWV